MTPPAESVQGKVSVYSQRSHGKEFLRYLNFQGLPTDFSTDISTDISKTSKRQVCRLLSTKLLLPAPPTASCVCDECSLQSSYFDARLPATPGASGVCTPLPFPPPHPVTIKTRCRCMEELASPTTTIQNLNQYHSETPTFTVSSLGSMSPVNLKIQ